MRQVNVDVEDVGDVVNPDADPDEVTVHGRTVADGVSLTKLNDLDLNIAGLAYDVNVKNLNYWVAPPFERSRTGDLQRQRRRRFGLCLRRPERDLRCRGSRGGSAQVDRLTLNGGEGNDSITGFGQLNGNAGDDMLTGGDYAQTISGGDGADQLYGGGGEDLLNGGAGEDLFVGGLGLDTINGGDTLDNIEWDTILVSGTSGGDTINVSQTSPTSLTHRVNTDTQVDTLGCWTRWACHRPDANGGRGSRRGRQRGGHDPRQDRRCGGAAWRIDAFYNALVTAVHGGAATGAGDRLVVIDDGPDDLTIYRKSQDDAAGTVSVGPGNAESFETVFDGIERVQFLDETGAAVNALPGQASRLVVFKHDPYEYNDDLFTATHLGAGDTINVDPTIDPGALINPFGDDMDIPGDADWYRLEAEVTGTLDVQVLFDEIATIVSSGRPGLPGAGNLDIALYDADGLVNGVPMPIAGTGAFGTNDADDDERIRIPAVAGQIYYLRIAGAPLPAGNEANASLAINNYSLTVINTAPPVPFDLELADNLTILTGRRRCRRWTRSPTARPTSSTWAADAFDLDLFVYGIDLPTGTTAFPNLTASHIHGPAGLGGSAAAIVTFSNADWVQEGAGIRLRRSFPAGTIPAANIADLLAGNTYINVHTSAHAAGEIRGQINILNVLGVWTPAVRNSTT